MKRREFIGFLVGGAVELQPLQASAQAADRVRRVAVLMGTTEDDSESRIRLTAFRRQLEKLGWVEGRNLLMQVRWAGGNRDRASAYASELIATRPDVCLAGGSTAMVALGRQTSTLPVVFANASDPIGSGLVASLARPGGNVTGFATPELTISGKYLEILKDAVPATTRVAIVFGSQTVPGSRSDFLNSLQAAGSTLALRPALAPLQDVAGIDALADVVGRDPGGGLVVLNDIFTFTNRKAIIAVAARHGLPAVYPLRVYAEESGLISYGADPADMFGRAGTYVDRILRGEKASDLPVQQPTRFQLVVNQRTAKALGIDMPPIVLVRADEVLE